MFSYLQHFCQNSKTIDAFSSAITWQEHKSRQRVGRVQKFFINSIWTLLYFQLEIASELKRNLINILVFGLNRYRQSYIQCCLAFGFSSGLRANLWIAWMLWMLVILACDDAISRWGWRWNASLCLLYLLFLPFLTTLFIILPCFIFTRT